MLAQRYDLVVVDGAADFPGQRIWIGEEGDDADRDLVWGSGRDADRAGFMAQLFAKLNESVRRTPVWGCVLIGGRSSRMGRPKHLLVGRGGKTSAEVASPSSTPCSTVSSYPVAVSRLKPWPTLFVFRIFPGLRGH